MRLSLKQSVVDRDSYSFIVAVCAVALASVFYAYEYMLRVSPSVMTSELMDWYHINDYQLASLIAFYYYIYSPMQLPVGLLVDRFGPQKILLFACFSCAIGTCLFSGTDMIWVARIGRLLVGMGSSFAFVGVLKLATVYLPSNYFAIIAGGTMALGQLGAFLCDLLITKLVQTDGIWAANVTLAWCGFALFVMMALVFTVQDRIHTKQEAAETECESLKEVFNQLLDLLSSPRLWTLSALGFFMCVPLAVFAEYLGIDFLKTAYGLNVEQAALCNSMFFMGMATGGLSMPFISNALGSRLVVIRVGALLTLTIFLSLFYDLPIHYEGLKWLVFSMGFFNSCKVLIFPIAKDMTDVRSAGTCVALINMTVSLCGTIFQPLVGFLLNHHSLSPHAHIKQDYINALSLVPWVILIAIPLTFIIKDKIVKTSLVEYAPVD